LLSLGSLTIYIYIYREKKCEPFYLLVEEPEVRVQTVGADGTLADLEINFRVVVHIVDAHLIADGKASHCDVVTICGLVPAGRDERVSL
jgi:hypothetical protein